MINTISGVGITARYRSGLYIENLLNCNEVARPKNDSARVERYEAVRAETVVKKLRGVAEKKDRQVIAIRPNCNR